MTTQKPIPDHAPVMGNTEGTSSRQKSCNRSSALVKAWTIFSTEGITIQFLIEKHSGNRKARSTAPNNLSLFHN